MRKRWVVPLTLVASFAVSGLAWAEGRYRTIEAMFGTVTFDINGEAARDERESIIYEGRVYVPIRSVSEMLGADVAWEPASQTVALDFKNFDYGSVLTRSNRSVYQYIAMENKKIVQSLTEHVRTGDTAGMRDDLVAWAELETIATKIGDAEMADYFAKLISSTEVLRSGWEGKQFDNYLIAWALFESSAEALLKHLNGKLG